MNGPGMNGPDGAALLDLLEPGWRRDLAAGAPAAALHVEAEVLAAAARALGEVTRGRAPAGTARTWPACVVVALAQVAGGDRDGSFWPGWHRAAGLRATRRSAEQWGQAFLGALAELGIAPEGAGPATARDAILAQAAPHGPAPAADETEGPRPRLEPFGRGVLLAGRPALPEEVADPGDPLLAFGTDGEPAGAELPAEPVWVLHPAAAELRCDVPPRVMVTSRLPLTWRGWRLVQLDLRGVRWLELAGPDELDGPDGRDGPPGPGGRRGRRGPRRPVRGRTGPRLVAGPPVPGVTAPAGDPVSAAPPAVLLPPGPGRWRVEVRSAGTGAVLAGLTAAGDGWRPRRLWQQVSRPVLGELIVTVTAADGAAGPGLRRTLTVAEGLAAAYFPAPRLIAEAGLEPAEAALSAPPEMTVSPQAAPVPAGVTAVEVTCVAGQARQRLRVTPPHARVRIDPEPGSKGTPTRWHHAGPLRLRAAELWHGGALALDLPGIDRAPPVEVVGPGGRVVQVLEPTRRGRYPLRRMADTVTACGGAALRVTVGGRTATIARISAAGGATDPWTGASW
jgi:hypothetical protein